jgi:hypothetical protein
VTTVGGWSFSVFALLPEALVSKLTLPIPRLSKAGMPSRSEGWGGAEREPYRAKQ